MGSNLKYDFLAGIILLLLFGACKKKDLFVSTPKEELLHCHQMPTKQMQSKQVRIHVEIISDSLSSVIVANNGVEFFLAVDSIQQAADLCQLLQQQIQYPEMLREMEIEGKWYYELTFDQHLMASWKMRKSVKDSVVMEKEIEKAFAQLKPKMRYFYKGNRTLTILVQANLFE
jgi:hypothetical protein